MAQGASLFCPRCGAPAQAGQRACPRCGLRVEDIGAGGGYLQAPQDYQHPAQQAVEQFAPPTAQPNYEPPIAPPVTPGKQRRGFNKIGCVSVLLLLLILLGVVAYFGASKLGIHVPGPGGAATQAAITSVPLNATVTYASVDLTLLNAQQSQNFVDDPNTRTDGMLRLNLQEHNASSNTVTYSYYDSAHLILPDKSSVAPIYVKAKPGIASGSTQTSLLDFAVPGTAKVNQLILRLGTDQEAQIAIPLTGSADLAPYRPRTVQPATALQYFGLDWTLSSAATQLSADGQQAPKGMRYIVVTLKVNNTLLQTAITGSPYDYIRLKSGSVTATPQSATLPVSFAAGASGETGTVSFLMPQSSTSFTLMLIAQKHSGSDPATANFQIV
ncbi:MAG: hypothetical protein M3Z08_16795 [Chloroflexota bacterium]|nr:hypothetical protein [Chloroflexota bacterium]